MTLALTIVSHHGIWQSSDMRLYDTNAGRPLPDASVKQFRLMFFNDDVALVTFAGIGRIGSSHVSDMMVNLLRGQPRTFDQTLGALIAFANERLIPALAHIPPKYRFHVFTVGAFSGGGPIYAEITNIDNNRGAGGVTWRPRADFRLAWRRPNEGEGIAAPAGAQFMSKEDLALLQRVCRRTPAKDADYLALLAGVNRRTSQRYPDMVSPECWALHAGRKRDPRKAPEEPTPFAWGGSMPNTSKPRTLTNGIDFEEALREMANAMNSYGESLPPPDIFQEASTRGLSRAMHFEPGHRVRHAKTGTTGRIVFDPGPAGPGSSDMEIAWNHDPTHPVLVDRKDVIVET